MIVPQGEHYQMVSSKAYVPTNNTQAREYGLDLDNGDGPDNQLGMVLGTLATMGFDIQGTIDEAVMEGSIILLVDFQTTDFTNASAAGINVLLGENPMPAPCTNPQAPTPETCSKHLAGTGSFDIAASSPMNAAVGGRIINGTFNGGPGDISLQIALGGTEAIQLDLIGARAKASGISADGMDSLILGGALTEEDLNTKVIPAIADQLGPTILEDCPMPQAKDCGCEGGSTGETVLGLFDGADGTTQDCMVSVAEIQANSLIQSLLAPDVNINGTQALSLGIKVETVKATF